MTTETTIFKCDVVWQIGGCTHRAALTLDKTHPASSYGNGVLTDCDGDVMAGVDFDFDPTAYILTNDRRVACNALGLPIDTPHVRDWTPDFYESQHAAIVAYKMSEGYSAEEASVFADEVVEGEKKRYPHAK